MSDLSEPTLINEVTSHSNFSFLIQHSYYSKLHHNWHSLFCWPNFVAEGRDPPKHSPKLCCFLCFYQFCKMSRSVCNSLRQLCCNPEHNFDIFVANSIMISSEPPGINNYIARPYYGSSVFKVSSKMRLLQFSSRHDLSRAGCTWFFLKHF